MAIPKFENRLKGMGWKPDHPKMEDWKFKDILALKYNTPIGSRIQLSNKSVDRRALGLNPPIMDQGNLGSCVGWATNYYCVGYLRRVDKDKLSTLYSALFGYYMARIRDGMQWKSADVGAYIRDAIDALRHEGAVAEKKWPYKVKRFADTPPPSVQREAKRWRLGAAWRCETIEQALKAIDLGYAVATGVSCYSSLFTKDVDQTGMVPMPGSTTRYPGTKDKFQGGHAIYLDHYDLSQNLIRNPGSWGEGVADGGHYYWPIQFIADKNLCEDTWAMESEAPSTTPWKNDDPIIKQQLELDADVIESGFMPAQEGDTPLEYGTGVSEGQVATEEEAEAFNKVANENSRNLEERE